MTKYQGNGSCTVDATENQIGVLGSGDHSHACLVKAASLFGGKKRNDWVAELTWLLSDNANISQLLNISYSTLALFEARLEKQINRLADSPATIKMLN